MVMNNFHGEDGQAQLDPHVSWSLPHLLNLPPSLSPGRGSNTLRLLFLNYERWFGSVTAADGDREASPSRFKDEELWTNPTPSDYISLGDM